MDIQQQVIEALFEHDAFHGEDSKVEGIAKLALDKGYDNLTPKQKYVIEHLMSQPCRGVVNPGGHHNRCQTLLTDEELIHAYRGYLFYGDLICESCQSEVEEFSRVWDRISRE